MKKVVGWIVLLILIVGSVCGIVFGIKYDNLKNSLEYKDNAEQTTTADVELNTNLNLIEV